MYRPFLSSILTSGAVDDQKLHEFSAETRNAKWLLDADIAGYLDTELRQRALRHQVIGIELQQERVGDRPSQMLKTQGELFTWLTGQYEVMDAKFARYLKLRH